MIIFCKDNNISNNLKLLNKKNITNIIKIVEIFVLLKQL